MERRICCVWLPRFGLSVASRLDPLGEDAAPIAGRRSSRGRVALYQPGTRWQALLECSPELERVGIRTGLPLKEAQGLCPDATYLPCDDGTLAAIARAFEAVIEALDAFSPVVEPAPPEVLGKGQAVAYLDVTGLELLYGPEARLAERLAVVAEEAGGCPARAGIASGRFAAWVAATLADCFGPADPGTARTARSAPPARVMVVPPAEEAVFLGPLPLETLPVALLPLQSRLALHRLGVRTLGSYARLPPNAVAHRYGPGGQRAQLLAQGSDDEPLRPRRLRPAARVEIAFDWEETELDRLRFALKMLADQLAARLATLAAAHEDVASESDGDADGGAGSGAGNGAGEGAGRHWPLDDDFCDPPAEPEGSQELEASEELEVSGELEGRQETQPPPSHGLQGRPALSLVRSPGPRSSPTSAGSGKEAGGRDGIRGGQEGHKPEPPPRGYAAEALHVVWRLSGGEQRELVLRLAEPACSAAVFAEHLRWHAEGLDRFLADGSSQHSTADPEPPLHTPSLPGPDEEPGNNPSPITHYPSPPDVVYEPMEQRLGVVGIAVEAVGVQLPGGTQLKLLASPLQLGYAAQATQAVQAVHAEDAGQWTGGGFGPTAALDPTARARQARRAVARLQARWGPQAVRQVTLTRSRLPEKAFQLVEPAIGLQVDSLPGTAGPADAPSTQMRWGDATPDEGAALQGHVPLWLVEPPEPVRVLDSRRKGGRALFARNRSRQELRILKRGGPWKLADPTQLTTGAPLRRDYYQIETEDSRAYLVYWDRVLDAWFLQGIFD